MGSGMVINLSEKWSGSSSLRGSCPSEIRLNSCINDDHRWDNGLQRAEAMRNSGTKKPQEGRMVYDSKPQREYKSG